MSQFKTLKTFDCYRAYYSQQDESHKTFHDCVRKHSSFNSFIEVRCLRAEGVADDAEYEISNDRDEQHWPSRVVDGTGPTPATLHSLLAM